MGAIEHLPPPQSRFRISADDYQRLGKLGVIAPESRVELLDGEIIVMAPIGSRHWAMVNRLDELLRDAVKKMAIVATQSSFRLDRYSEPEPDIALFKRREDFYTDALPKAEDTLLVVEVSDSSARYDREIKLPRYAAQGIPEVWIVDLDAQVFRLHRGPRGADYIETSVTATPGIVELVALPGVEVDLTGLLG